MLELEDIIFVKGRTGCLVTSPTICIGEDLQNPTEEWFLQRVLHHENLHILLARFVGHSASGALDKIALKLEFFREGLKS